MPALAAKILFWNKVRIALTAFEAGSCGFRFGRGGFVHVYETDLVPLVDFDEKFPVLEEYLKLLEVKSDVCIARFVACSFDEEAFEFEKREMIFVQNNSALIFQLGYKGFVTDAKISGAIGLGIAREIQHCFDDEI